MRLAAAGLATLALVTIVGCTTTGTPPPSSITVSPVAHPATSPMKPTPTGPSPTTAATAAATADGTATTVAHPQQPHPAVRLSAHGVGPLTLGIASRSESAHLLLGALGKAKLSSAGACVGEATSLRWGALIVSFAGNPQVAKAWQVDTRKATSGFQLPRGSEWRPERTALIGRGDAAVSTDGEVTTVILANGLGYVFVDGDERARAVRAGATTCR